MSADRPRVVYDCNVFIQALINIRGPAGRCFEKARAGEVLLFVSEFILDEIRESYLKVPTKYGVTREQSDALALAVTTIAAFVSEVPAVFTYDRDPDDAHYVNVALTSSARLVVSRDRDLLDLMDPARAEGRAFLSQFPELRIVEPVAFLRELDAASRQRD